MVAQQRLQYQDTEPAVGTEDTSAPANNDASGDDAMTQVDRQDWRTNHTINIRIGIPLPFARCYLTIVGGKERRNPDRRADERQKHRLATKGNIIFLGVMGLITGLALFTAIQFAARLVLEKAGVV